MDGKVVVVTGASGALGKVVAEAALARGAKVAGVDHAASQISATANRIEFGGVDLSDAAQAKKAIDAAAAQFGRLDALINIPGAFAFETVAEGTRDGCPISRALKGNVRLSVDATLEEDHHH